MVLYLEDSKQPPRRFFSPACDDAGEWVRATFGHGALKEQNDTVLTSNTTTLDLAGVGNFSYIVPAPEHI
jgi:hypothetical protein